MAKNTVEKKPKREKTVRIQEPVITPFYLNKKLVAGLILFVEVAILVTGIILLRYFTNGSYIWIYWIVRAFAWLMLIPIVNSRMDPAYKIIWLAIMVVLPVLGATLYLLFANKKFSKKEKKQVEKTHQELDKIMSYSSHGMINKINIDKDPNAYNIAQYIRKNGHTEIYDNTETTYYPWGEDAFPVMLEKLRSAKHYIFMEYFIIEQGHFWNSILEILIEKAEQGVDVRVVYDDLGCMSTLPNDYDKYLESVGIKCSVFAPIRPFLDIRMNNRDHRKILVIDGHTGFTGGINIADEYINEKIRFGKWKDNAIMLHGYGVFGLTTLFLETWSRLRNEKIENFAPYLPTKYLSETTSFKSDGLVQPYGSIPYTFETIGLNVYQDIIFRAKKYLYISTPYLILNSEMMNAIMMAAKNGVDVRMLTPHIPDKKIVFGITRSFYKQLIEAGVRVYEYVPGFVHAKTFIADDEMGTVGTINLDYRSLFLHSENGVFLYKTKTLRDIKRDFENTFMVSKEFTLDVIEKEFPLWYRGFVYVLRIFAPIL
ncbi:MAG: cardiolipin synthase [Bacilli bacterium]|nr:cardiolipin synthase [Bacilli bacterium]